jgi:hypothetical protein
VTRRLPSLPGTDNDLAARVRVAPPGDYLAVFHPGEDDPAGLMRRFHLSGQSDNGSIARERDAERALLCQPSFTQQLTEAGATLVSYTEILTQ